MAETVEGLYFLSIPGGRKPGSDVVEPDAPGSSGHTASGAESFRSIFEAHYGRVMAFFTRKGLSPEEARDLAQETFLRAYKGARKRRARTEEEIRAWLFTIARNLWKNRLRFAGADKRDAKEVSLEARFEQGRPVPVFVPGERFGRGRLADPLDHVLEGERARVLRDALEELPPRMRRCVLLRLNHELKYREIAVILQVSVETVKAQLFHARTRLEELLGDYFEGVEW